jgi:hypothetical protein
VAFWTATHVVNKLLKAMSPAIAHRDATTSIAVIVIIFFIEASSFYANPNIYQRMALSSSKLPT